MLADGIVVEPEVGREGGDVRGSRGVGDVAIDRVTGRIAERFRLTLDSGRVGRCPSVGDGGSPVCRRRGSHGASIVHRLSLGLVFL